MIGGTNTEAYIATAIDARKSHTLTIISDTYGAPQAASIYIDNTYITGGSGRGTDVYRFNKSDLSLTYHGHWDTYGNTGTANNVATEIGKTTVDEIVMATCGDASTKNSTINSTLSAFGVSTGSTWSESRTAFYFVGVRGTAAGHGIYGEGSGNPQYSCVILPSSNLGLQDYNGKYVKLNENNELTIYDGPFPYFGY